MKALVLKEHGTLDQLQTVADYPLPQVDSGHVVVRIEASSFNYHDIFTVRGMPGIKVPLPVVIGLDAAGVIDKVGDGVSGWKVGDRVLINPLQPGVGLLGEMIDGGMQEYIRVDASTLLPLPDNVGFDEAAALPVAYGTAHRMLITHKTVKAGDTVLILGESGGVGTASVLLAKLLGAHVIAAAGSEEKGEKLLALGADEFINYRKTDFRQWVRDHYGKPQRRSYEGGVDVIINFTGGDTWLPSIKSVKRGGKILVCGATAGFAPQEDLRYVWTFELEIKGSNSFYRENLVSLLDLVANKKLHPAIDSVVPLSQAKAALQRLADRQVIGKIIVHPGE